MRRHKLTALTATLVVLGAAACAGPRVEVPSGRGVESTAAAGCESSPPSSPGDEIAPSPLDGAPATVVLVNDDFHAKHVGRTADGWQFFLTTPFVPLGSDYVAVYLFDPCGTLVEARIDDLGPRTSSSADESDRRYAARLAELGDVTLGPIEVKPFSIERFGTTFGFIPFRYEGDWWVEVEPGNYMAFHEPWDSGEYDTQDGDFSKTSMSPTGAWQAGTSGADFSWNCAMTVPPVPGGKNALKAEMVRPIPATEVSIANSGATATNE